MCALLCWASTPVVPARAAEPTVTETAERVAGTPESDGQAVGLDVSLFTADAARPAPAIVLAHGFGGSKDDLVAPAQRLARDGYSVVTYTARGFGASGGRIHLGDPAYEGADAAAVVAWTADRPEVAQVDGDPLIGVAGVSYGGNAALLAAARDQRVDAVVAGFTWGSLTQALFPQYLVTDPARSAADVPGGATGVFKKQWAALFFRGGAAGSRSGTDQGAGGAGGSTTGGTPSDAALAALCGRFDRDLCRGYLDAAASGTPGASFRSLVARADLAPSLARITAPTLVIAGEQDTLFPLDQSDSILRGLPAATPAELQWVEGGHDGEVSADLVLGSIEDWFDRRLASAGAKIRVDDRASSVDSAAERPLPADPATSGFRVVVAQTGLVGRGDEGVRAPQTYGSAAYPGRGQTMTTATVPLDGTAQTVVAPPGGSPASFTSAPGGGALTRLTAAASLTGYNLAVLPGQSAVFTSAPVAQAAILAGSPRVRLRITSSTTSATVFAGVWDLGPPVTGSAGEVPGSAVLPLQAMAPVQLTGLVPGQETVAEVALPPVVHQMPAGHRWQLVVSSTDQAYAVPVRPAVYTVALDSAGLTMPVFGGTALGRRGPDVPVALLVGFAVVLSAAVAAVVVFWLRRRAAHPRDDLRGTPLVVEGLAKTYRGGFQAVRSVSFTAEPGQIVGLLGPNGAGKTTVMRMLVGLIRPDAGTIYVDGEPVHAGADVLGSVGAFIEGPGFLPHLSGLANLQAYWAATGRPLEEAHLEEALAIAGLGTAIERRVRGYSQGMRQRLGIAQAMLGLPELLVLDEPTNGLDPPQIKAMRGVLADYAATGRTVVVSSHLLAEVQQTCTHVVVMHRGRVVLTGSMAELTARDDVTVIGLAAGSDPARATAALADLGLSVADTDEGLRVSGALPRSRIVAELVAAGVAIDSVDGHRQLEEVFLTLVGTSDE